MINFLRPALGSRFLAVGRVENAGRSLTVCAGEVRAFREGAPDDERDCKVVALMQATIVNVANDLRPAWAAGDEGEPAGFRHNVASTGRGSIPGP